MQRVTIIFGLLMVFSFSACGGTMKQYEKSEVAIISVDRSSAGETQVTYQPILDSMYYCPGANVRQEGGRQKVSFVRCQIDRTCPVDVIAEKLGRGQLRVAIPIAAEEIDVVFRDGEMQLRVPGT